MKKFTKIALMGAMGLLFVGCSSFPKDIVSDSATGLMWQDDAVGKEATWEDAIDRCEALTVTGVCQISMS